MEKDNKLPKGWVWTRLGEVSTVITGNTPPKNDKTNYGNYIPFVKPPELKDSIIFEVEDNLSEKGSKIARVVQKKFCSCFLYRYYW